VLRELGSTPVIAAMPTAQNTITATAATTSKGCKGFRCVWSMTAFLSVRDAIEARVSHE
jgi:hypothetical protein